PTSSDRRTMLPTLRPSARRSPGQTCVSSRPRRHRRQAPSQARLLRGKRRTARRRSTDHCTTLTKLEVTILDSKVEVSKHNRRPKAPAVPFPRVSLAQELVLSTVTARRFCDQQEISLHTATGRSLP